MTPGSEPVADEVRVEHPNNNGIDGVSNGTTMSIWSLDLIRQSTFYKFTKTILIVLGTIIIAVVMVVRSLRDGDL